MKANKTLWLILELFLLNEMSAAAFRDDSAVINNEAKSKAGFLERAVLRKEELMTIETPSADELAARRRYIIYIDKLKNELVLIYKIYLTFLRTLEARINESYTGLAAERSFTERSEELSRQNLRRLAEVRTEIDSIIRNAVRWSLSLEDIGFISRMPEDGIVAFTRRPTLDSPSVPEGEEIDVGAEGDSAAGSVADEDRSGFQSNASSDRDDSEESGRGIHEAEEDREGGVEEGEEDGVFRPIENEAYGYEFENEGQEGDDHSVASSAEVDRRVSNVEERDDDSEAYSDDFEPDGAGEDDRSEGKTRHEVAEFFAKLGVSLTRDDE